MAAATRMSPLSAKMRSPRSVVRDRPAPSPNYFNPLVSPPSKPTEPGAEFEAFRRQSESNSFSLSHGNLSHFSASPGSRNASNVASRAGSRERASTNPSPHTQPVRATGMDGVEKETQTGDVMDVDPPSPSRRSNSQSPAPFNLQSPQPFAPSFFDRAQNNSPANVSSQELASLGRNHLSAVDERHPRNSLPNNRIDPPSPMGKRHPARAETLPSSLSNEGPNLISPQELRDMLEGYPSEDILLLDVRVYPQYSQSRISGALNLCIPTTLLKRPAFNVQKLAETFTKESEKEKFALWREAKVIVVYDASSLLLKDATSSVNTLKKFSAEGWQGSPCVVKGGFSDFLKKSPDLIDKRPANEMDGPQGRKLSINPQRPPVAPVAGGCLMPSDQTAANPFFGNIRQNEDLVDGVGQMKLKVPHYLREPGNKYLPLWLKRASDEKDAGKSVADRFLQIEKGEQQRMQKALSGSVHYGSPNIMSPNAIRIAGIEKGTKNRYKNILPYDHTRVRLQDVPAGGCDYINASHIRSSTSNRRYIASQAPVPATIEDFWRVAWEQNVHVIVMLTAEHDGGQRKSHPYWDGVYGSYQAKVNRTSQRPLKGSTPRTPAVVNGDTPSVLIREIALSRNGESRTITQLHYSGWPDFGIPTDPAHLLGIVRICREEVRRHGLAIDDKVAYDALPIVVHCSAGCGRTGTFCTVDSVVATLEAQMQEKGLKIQDFQNDDTTEDLITRTVEDFRHQRLSMVQTLRQFVLCYETVLEWFASGLKGPSPASETRGSSSGERPKSVAAADGEMQWSGDLAKQGAKSAVKRPAPERTRSQVLKPPSSSSSYFS